jgi:hypothetical protein
MIARGTMKDIEKLGRMIDEAIAFARAHQQPFIAHLLTMASLETSRIVEQPVAARPLKKANAGKSR